MSRARVLLVDDEEEFLDVLAKRLRARDIDVAVAMDGRAALERAAEGVYDLVVLDIRMPEMDGIEALRVLRQTYPDLAAVLVTGHATVDKAVEAMKLGAQDVLQKPADIHELIDRIEQAKVDRLIVIEQRHEERIRKILAEKEW